MNGRLQAICFLFWQELATGSILFISRFYRVSGVSLKMINTGRADRGGGKR